MSGPWFTGQLPPRALQELAAWQETARDWPLTQEGPVARCDACGQCAVRTHDRNGRPYRMTGEERLTQIVAHLRQCHPAAVTF